VTGDSGRAVWLEQARSYLRGADPVLARLIDARPDFDPRAWLARLPPMDLFGALLFQVIGQQLSVAATRRTLARIGALFDGHLPAPAGLLAVDPAKLREAGLSWRKIGCPTTSCWPHPRRQMAASYLFAAAYECAEAPPAASRCRAPLTDWVARRVRVIGQRRSLREVMPSLVNTLPRCHSTVCRLMNSWAAISWLVCPSRATLAIWASTAHLVLPEPVPREQPGDHPPGTPGGDGR
jgi:hypothetical protein